MDELICARCLAHLTRHDDFIECEYCGTVYMSDVAKPERTVERIIERAVVSPGTSYLAVGMTASSAVLR